LGRNLKISSGITVALICIMITFTLSGSLQTQIKRQLDSIFPNQLISIQNVHKKLLSYHELFSLSNLDMNEFIYGEPADYEFMGVSLQSDYEVEKTIYISDMTKPIKSRNLEIGRETKNSNEIVLSKTTATHLNPDYQKLLNQQLYGYYLKDDQIKGVSLTVVGIGKDVTAFDTIYINELANLDHISQAFAIDKKRLLFQLAMINLNSKADLDDLLMDLEDLEYVSGSLKLLGSKGTTGTQASFLELFDGDQETIDKIDPMIAEKMGFQSCYPVSGQTYSRKVDTRVLNVLAGIAASAHKFSNDIRLLQHLKEVEEPFEKSQIGSSAMAYKRNPMRSERIASLSRYVMADALNPAITSATQWFERTLDDSANKRLSIPEGFLAVDGILDLCLNVVDGLVVYPKVIEKRLRAELPFMATENIMMDAVKAGGDRQELHERIRELSMEAGRNVKEKGLDNNLLELIAADPAFNMTLEELQKTMEPSRYTGRAKEQVETFLTKVVRPVLEENRAILGMTAEINV
jgi:hypothetical protein